jgi:hypothetical protein
MIAIPRLLISLCLFAVWLSLWALGFPAVAIGLLFCGPDDEFLPRLFGPWQNPTGINGTLNGNNPIWPRITNGKHRTYRYRWIWLAWRNPVSGFSHWIGAPMNRPVTHVEYHFVTVNKMPGRWFTYWDYALRIPYGKTGRGLLIRFGWKLSDRGQLINRISPLKRF